MGRDNTYHPKFGFSDYKDLDFFHARFGRGVVIVAVDKIDDERFPKGQNAIGSDKQVALTFHEINGEKPRNFIYVSLFWVQTFTEIKMRGECSASTPPVDLWRF